MSDNNVQVEFGGQVAPSYDSSVEHVKKGLREQAVEYGKLAVEVAASATSTYAVHKAKASAIQAAWNVASATTREAFGAMAAKGVSTGVSIAESFVRVLPALARVSGGMALISVGTTVLSGAMRVLRAASDEVNEGLSRFADQEDLVSKLKPLTGGLDAAKDKLKDLASFAKGTKLETPEVVDAYRSTQVQTGGALSDKKGLTMLGDVAQASGNGLKDTADAVGKLYGDLQAGAPINDATEKLKEMGIVSAEVTQHIYTLQGEGKSGAEIWAYLAGQLQKTSGAMQAASDNLSTLQKSLADAKNRLHELFAEASVGGGGGEDEGLKGQIKGQIATLEALQPAAKEAGNVFASLRNVFSDAVKYLLSLRGSTDGVTTATNNANDSTLRHVGSLRTWVDVLTVAAVAVSGVAAVAVGYGVALTAGGVATLALHAALATGSASAILGASALQGLAAAAIPLVLAFGAVATVVLSAGVAYRVYADHAIEADKRLASLIDTNRTMLASLHEQGRAVKTVTDNLLVLAKAYQELDAVQAKLAKTKDLRQREELEKAEKQLRNEIQRREKAADDGNLKPGEARAKSEKETKDAKGETDDLLNDPQKKYADALSDMEEARKKQYELREKLAAAQKAAAPGGEATDAVIEPQIQEAKDRIKASQDRMANVYLADPDKEKATQEAERQKIRDLQGLRAGRQQRIENARTDLAAQDTVVARSGTNLAQNEKAGDEYQAKLRQLEIEKQIAALDVEGLARAREEWLLKRAGLEAELAALHGTDKTKSGEIEVKIAQGDAGFNKQQEEVETRARELGAEAQIAALKTEGIQKAREEWAIRRAGFETELSAARKHGDIGKENEVVTKIVQGDATLSKQNDELAQRKATLEDEQKIAALKTEGIQKAREEWAIRRARLEVELAAANKKGDEGKVAEITTKITQGDTGLQKEERKDADSEREVDAEARIAALQSEGIERARAESEIRLGLIEARWKEAMAAKDTLAADKARLDYIKEQKAIADKNRENALAEGNDLRALTDAIANRQDAAAKRELDRRFKEGKIDDKEHRQGEAGLVERERLRLEADATAKEKEARDALEKGDKDKALRLTKEAQQIHGQADAKKDEENNLLNPIKPRTTPIADDLRKIGGGGNAYYGTGSNPLEAKQDKTNTLLERIDKHLEASAKRDNRQRVL